MLAPRKKSYEKPRQHIKKQRHHFADKDPHSQSCGFSSSHVRMWELDHNEGCVCVLSCFSHVWLFVTLWAIAHQAPLSMGFSREECWSELPLPSTGDLPNPGIKVASPKLEGRFFTTEPPGNTSVVFYLKIVSLLAAPFHQWVENIIFINQMKFNPSRIFYIRVSYSLFFSL